MSAKIEVPLRMLKDAIRSIKNPADADVQAEAIKGLRSIIISAEMKAKSHLQSRFFESCLSDIKKSEGRRNNQERQPSPASVAAEKESQL